MRSKVFFLFLIILLTTSRIAPQIPTAKADTNTWQIGASENDCLKFNGGFSIVHGNFYMDRTPGTALALENGVRFTNISIPKGAIIDSAYLEVYSTAVNGIGGSLLIEGLLEADDDADAFSTLVNFDGRIRTGATVNWNFQAMAANEWVSTPDIKTIIQEIIDRANWSSGNALALGTDDNTNQAPNTFRVSPSWDLDNAHAPKLTITWTAVFPPSDPDLLFGAGFNATAPYVELHWNHSLVDVWFFEVQNSSDAVSWTYLGQSSTANYTDSQVINGTERYYRIRAVNQTMGTWYNSSFTDINFETVYFIEAVGGTIYQDVNVSSEWVSYNLTEIGVIVGTLDSGDLNSTLDIDGDMFNVSEVVGAPGMLISGNFSGIDPDAECMWIVIYSLYDGNLNHDFDIELWNFTGSAWVEDGPIPDMVAFEWTNSTIYGLRIPNDFLSGGEVRVRLDHEAPGNINHDLFIEYFKLLAEIPAGPAVGAGIVIVNVIESDFPWIAIAIILMCVAYLLFRRFR